MVQAVASDPLGVVDHHLDDVDLVALREEALRLGERHEDDRAVVLGHAELEDGRDLILLRPRRSAERRRRAARRDRLRRQEP